MLQEHNVSKHFVDSVVFKCFAFSDGGEIYLTFKHLRNSK